MTDLRCSVDGCGCKLHARGWCAAHYKCWWATGDPLSSLVPDSPDLPGERWRPVPGWEGYYSVSDHGRVRSVARVINRSDGSTQRVKARVLRLGRGTKGRPIVILYASGQGLTQQVHRLVAAAFIGPCPPGLEVCHNNGDPTDNLLPNLRYDTRSENMFDKQRHGTDHQRNKVRCPWGHLLAAPNLVAVDARRGRRNCLACSRARGARQSAERRGVSVPDFQATADAYFARIMAA
jgi:hypothetical protein